jgi:hypothetical protein
LTDVGWLENPSVADYPSVKLARESAKAVAPNIGRVAAQPTRPTPADLELSVRRHLPEPSVYFETVGSRWLRR